MRTKTKGMLVLGCACAFVLAAGAGAGLTAFAEGESQSPQTTVWTKAPENGSGLPATWTDNGDGTLTNTNNAFTDNFLLTTNENLVGDYSVEATFQGSQDTEVTAEINMGIVPWFKDNANYAVMYMVWRQANGFNMINVQTICFLDGAQQGWNDHWLDYAYATTLFQFKPTDKVTMHVDKVYDTAQNLDVYTVKVSGTLASGTQVNEAISPIGFSVSAPHAAEQAYAGLYTCNDTVTVSNFKTQSLTDTGVYKHVAAGATGKSSSSQGWSYASGTYSVDATGGTAEQNQMILDNEYDDGNYQLSYTANCKGGGY